MLSKTFVLGIIVLFIGIGISPIMTAESIYSINEEVRTIEEDTPSKLGIIPDNLLIVTRVDLRNLLVTIFVDPSRQIISTRIYNLNRMTVTICVNSTLKTKDNEVLWEDGGRQRNVRHRDHTYLPSFDYDDFKNFDYPYGGFELILNIRVPEAETDITVVHHGYFIGIFAIIFNPFGERI